MERRFIVCLDILPKLKRGDSLVGSPHAFVLVRQFTVQARYYLDCGMCGRRATRAMLSELSLTCTLREG